MMRSPYPGWPASDDFTIEPMRCAHCGEIVEGDIFAWAVNHSCVEGTIQQGGHE